MAHVYCTATGYAASQDCKAYVGVLSDEQHLRALLVICLHPLATALLLANMRMRDTVEISRNIVFAHEVGSSERKSAAILIFAHANSIKTRHSHAESTRGVKIVPAGGPMNLHLQGQKTLLLEDALEVGF